MFSQGITEMGEAEALEKACLVKREETPDSGGGVYGDGDYR